MFLAIHELPIIDGPIFEFLLSLPMGSIVFPISFVGEPMFFCELCVSVRFVVMEFSFDDVSVAVNQYALAFYPAICPKAIILRTIRPYLDPSTMLNILFLFTFKITNNFHLTIIPGTIGFIETLSEYQMALFMSFGWTTAICVYYYVELLIVDLFIWMLCAAFVIC